jgi:hypothetical protein
VFFDSKFRRGIRKVLQSATVLRTTLTADISSGLHCFRVNVAYFLSKCNDSRASLGVKILELG